ncbi:hypothetical protein BDIM_30030 [Brevundimonas diminuta ATCC 11568]|nr:hypothetical protein BDIM_30030 [Brevundimonas diminuta ATCC 11568]
MGVRRDGGFCTAHRSSIDRAKSGCTVRRVAAAETTSVPDEETPCPAVP